jgi:hypothetical protein
MRKASPYADAIRNGIHTRGANGIFFVDILERGSDWVRIRNAPARGRLSTVPQLEAVVESEAVRLLIRGEDVSAERVTPNLGLLFFHDEEHVSRPLSESEARLRFPRALAFAKHFESFLRSRRRFRNFNPTGEDWLGIYSVTAAVLAEHKVVVREIASDLLAARLSSKEAIPDHKLYVIPCGNADEAQNLSLVLNSEPVRAVVRSSSMSTSLTGSFLRYVGIRSLSGHNGTVGSDDWLANSLGLTVVQLRALRDHLPAR